MKQAISLVILLTLVCFGCIGQTQVGNGIQFNVGTPPTFAPGSISASIIGQHGIMVYYYWVVVHYPIGTTLVQGPVMVTGVPNTLSVTNYVQIVYPILSKATGYDVLRTTTNVFPGGTNTIAVAINSASNLVVDQSNTLSSYTYAPSVQSAQANVTLNNIDYPNPFIVFDTPIHDLTVANLNVTTSYTGVGGGGGGCGAICNVTTLNATTVNTTDLIATGDVTANNVHANTAVLVGESTTTPGVLTLQNPGTVPTSVNTVKANTSGNSVPRTEPGTVPFNVTTNNFGVDAGLTLSSPMICNSFVDANGDYECRFGPTSVPMGSNNSTLVTQTLSLNQYYPLICIKVPSQMLQLAATIGREIKLYAQGLNAIGAGKSPSYQMQLAWYTNSTCGAGTTVLGTYDIVQGLGALTTAPWTATADILMNTATSWLPSGKWNINASAASTTPSTRILSANAAITFDPSTCTGGFCGLGLLVSPNGGNDALITYTQTFGFATMF